MEIHRGRGEFARMMEDIKSGKDGVSFILVFKLSRFGRNAADVLSTLQTLQDYGSNLICVEDGIDSSKLESALIGQPKTPNRQDVGKDVGLEVGLAEKIIELISDNSGIKMSEMAEKLEVTTRTIEREMKKLRESGRVKRVGGKRYGHWKIND